jgi:hypothetical protein
MSATLPQAAGTLETTPFADLLVRAHDQRATGTLVLEEPGGLRHGVYFDDGEPKRAKVVSPGAHLGEVLVKRGQLSPDVHRATLERARERQVLHGQLLVAEGFLSEDALEAALSEQLMRQLLWLFGQPRETKYGYFQGTNFLEHWGGPAEPSLQLLELLWRGIRDHARGFEIETALARIGGRRIEIRRELPREHFAFLGDDVEVVERLRLRPARLLDLIVPGSASEIVTKRVLCFLVLSRSLELDVPSAPPVGLERGTLPETVFPRSPRVPEFTSHDGSSASALRRPLPETGSAPEAAKLLGAQMAFHRAETQLARGQLELALREAKAALDIDPAKPEHIALHAYLTLLQPGADPRHALSEFDRAIERLEAGIKVHWYRGLALKRLDRHASALREFRAVLEEDPHHIDAAREVHIYEERLRRSPKERPSLAPEPERRPSVILDWAKKLKG